MFRKIKRYVKHIGLSTLPINMQWKYERLLLIKHNRYLNNGQRWNDCVTEFGIRVLNAMNANTDESVRFYVEKNIVAISKDFRHCYIQYAITPDEYFMYKFQYKNAGFRSSILSQQQKDEICICQMGANWQQNFWQLKDKWLFYQLAKPYFKRDVVKIENGDFEEVDEFCKKHQQFVAKPRYKSCGLGVHIVNMNQYATVKDVFDKYLTMDGGGWMFEEMIKQSPEMAIWHPSSVNTIRIPSVRTPLGCKVILPLFRTGKNNNFVDNCHNDGGLMSVPDAKTGKIITEGYDVFTNVVKTHPNSDIRFLDWQVPRWEELLKICSELHESLPAIHKYVGFDFALTDKGWLVVEGNWGNFPHQVCVGHGIKVEFEKLMKS